MPALSVRDSPDAGGACCLVVEISLMLDNAGLTGVAIPGNCGYARPLLPAPG